MAESAQSDLRRLVEELVKDLPGTHDELPGVCAALGLPEPPPGNEPDEPPGHRMSLRDRREAVLRQINPSDYLEILQRFLDRDWIGGLSVGAP
jgi:hypothetical protein